MRAGDVPAPIYPTLKSGGPIEATMAFVPLPPPPTPYPPLKSGGPIEAGSETCLDPRSTSYPPLKSGGPIEAADGNV